MKWILLAILGLLLTTLVKAQTNPFNFATAAAYSRAQGGDAVLVMQNGKIVFEEYQNGYNSLEPHLLASGTKSFSGAMLAAAIEDGLITGFDEFVSDTILEWRSDTQKKNITIRQLLSLTSGIQGGEIGAVPSYEAALQFRVSDVVGTKFQYGPVPFQIFGEIMRRKLKSETVSQYLERRIFRPIGLKVGLWTKANTGMPNLPSGAYLTAREWIKFGQLIEQNSVWNGEKILSSELLKSLFIGSSINPAYGMTFWLNASGQGVGLNTDLSNGIVAGLPDLSMAAGAGNQRLYVIPSLDMVIVRFGRLTRYSDAEFINSLLKR